MVLFEFNRFGDTAHIIFDGEITKNNACKVKEALMFSLNNADKVIVDMERVSKIDSICAALFDTAQKKAKRLKKFFIFSDRRQDAIHRLLTDARQTAQDIACRRLSNQSTGSRQSSNKGRL